MHSQRTHENFHSANLNLFSHSNFSFSYLRVFCGVAGLATMAGRTNCSQLQIPFCWCQLLKRRLSLNRFLLNFSSNFLSVAGFFYIFRFILPWDSFMWSNWIPFYQLVFFRNFKLPRRRLSPHRFNHKIRFNFMYVAWFFFVFRFIFHCDSFMWFNWIRFCQFVCFRDFQLPKRRLSLHRVTLDFSSSFLSVTWFLFCFSARGWHTTNRQSTLVAARTSWLPCRDVHTMPPHAWRLEHPEVCSECHALRRDSHAPAHSHAA